jgi:ZIP family zinc transporter
MAKSKIRILWWAIAGVSAISAAIGFAIVNNSGTLTGVLVEAFAAGALLTMIADEMAPEAFDRSSIYAGLATVGGFAFALWLTSLE